MSFETHWAQLTQGLTESFTPKDKRLARLFYGIGITDSVQSVGATIKLLIDSTKSLEHSTPVQSMGGTQNVGPSQSKF